eukprot:scaffold24827_cov105-Skeletonema_dohrnii-CCMP3373.AAC.4
MKQSAFKPTLGPSDWEVAIDKYVDAETKNEWKKTKEGNEKFFNELEEEAQAWAKNKNLELMSPSIVWSSMVLAVSSNWASSGHLHLRGCSIAPTIMIGLQDQCKSTSILSWPNRMGH